MTGKLTKDEIATYHHDGFLHLPGIFDPAELEPIQRSLREDPSVNGHILHFHDGVDETRDDHQNGYRLDYMGWFREGDDWLGTCTRLERIVDRAAVLIGEPVYHYHSKLVRKPMTDSGTLVWHQDFGGWYQDGCVMPDMLTFVIALTDADDTSGCFRFLRGSHKMGRVDRIRSDHAYANIQPQRLAAMLEQFEEVPAEMRAGDGLFFHGNLVHCSGPNDADFDRWLIELSYNGVSNAPVFDDQQHHAVKPMRVAPDNSLLDGEYSGVFGSTPILDATNPSAEGASIFNRDSFPDLS